MGKIIIAVFLLTCSVLLSCECPIPIGDSGIFVKGKVYEWINAPEDATSKIFIVSPGTYDDMIHELEILAENIKNDMTVIPVKDASIKIGEERDFKYSDHCRGCVIKEESDENGDFYGEGTLPGFKFKFQVKITHPDYIEAAGDIEHGDYFDHAIVAVLVKNNQ